MSEPGFSHEFPCYIGSAVDLDAAGPLLAALLRHLIHDDRPSPPDGVKPFKLRSITILRKTLVLVTDREMSEAERDQIAAAVRTHNERWASA